MRVRDLVKLESLDSLYMKESSAQRSSPLHKARTRTSAASKRPEACGTARA